MIIFRKDNQLWWISALCMGWTDSFKLLTLTLHPLAWKKYTQYHSESQCVCVSVKCTAIMVFSTVCDSYDIQYMYDSLKPLGHTCLKYTLSVILIIFNLQSRLKIKLWIMSLWFLGCAQGAKPKTTFWNFCLKMKEWMNECIN